MKTTIILLLSMIAYWQTSAQSAKQSTDISHVLSQFQSPEAHYRSAPLWVWNTKVDKKYIDEMLQEFKDKSFGGVFVHPRPGLITPYLSQEWMQLWKYALEKAKDLKLEMWIYDENSYPTGFAGGHVPHQMPESFNQGQIVSIEKKTSLSADDAPFIVLKKQSDSTYKNISSQWKDEIGKTADYALFSKSNYGISPWYAGFSYVDLMVPGVTEKFLDISMRQAYEKDFKEEFGKTIKGIFSDEPNIETGGDKMRWTPLLFPTFEKQWGYKLEDNLISLFEETGDYKKVRHNYRQVLLYLFIEYWAKPMNKYTTENNLEWTGHYWEHGWPNPNHGPDNMAMYAWHQRPAIDMLFNQFDEVSSTAQFGNIRAVKELSSAANQMNAKRTLSETYGGAGWELSFKDMKRLGDWEYVLGVNSMNQHLSTMTLQGVRKYDYPPTFTYHNVWWKNYQTLNQYFNRLSLALSNGKQKNDILIIEPTSTTWFYFVGSIYKEHVAKLGNDFQAFVSKLEKNQVEYDLGSEDIIKDHGSISGKQFIVGHAAYQKVVIPKGTENLNLPTFLLLNKFKQAGGEILFFDIPQYIDGTKDKRLEELMQDCSLLQGQELSPQMLSKHFKSNKIQFHNSSFGDLYHHRREFDQGQILFLSNASLTQSVQGDFTIDGKDVQELDLFTGTTKPYPQQKSADGKLLLAYNLPEAGSKLLYISNTALPKTKTMQQAAAFKGKNVQSSSMAVKRQMPNVLTVDFCDIHFADQSLKNQYFDDASNALYRHHGFQEGNPWCTSVQFKDEILRRDTFTAGSGFSVDYHFNISQNDASSLSDIKAVVERIHLWDVFINGEAIKAQAGEWWLDKDFAVFDIQGKLRQGENTICLRANKMSIFAEIEPIYIIGDFNLKAQAKSWQIAASAPLALGSWKEQGLPLYGHDVAYSKTFTAKKGNNYQINIPQWEGTVASLKVNGILAAVLIGNERQYNISSLVQSGTNTIELIVTGSLKNTLGPFYRKANGYVTPWHWRGVKEMIPGAEYDLFNYGLMEDFFIATDK